MRSIFLTAVLFCFCSDQSSAQEYSPFQIPTQESEPVFEKPWETIEGTPAQEIADVAKQSQVVPVSGTPLDETLPNATSAPKPDAYQDKLLELKKLQRIESLVEKLLPRVTPSIVSIGETASGVIVKPSGIVITASHVTRKAGRTLIIRLQDGRTVKGITLGSNAANDTSAIQLLGGGPWPYLKTVQPEYTAEAGQWCIAFGYPLSWPRDKPANARIGRVTGQYRGKIVTDCPIMGGDSGGALVDLNGNLLGINSSVRLDVTQNLHVPIARYREDWKSMMSRKDVDIVTTAPKSPDTTDKATPTKKPYLGIYGESSGSSVRIRDVRRNSPAEKAGLLPEDVIWQINETPIESFAELLKYLATRKGGDQINVGINRFGVNLEVIVALEER